MANVKHLSADAQQGPPALMTFQHSALMDLARALPLLVRIMSNAQSTSHTDVDLESAEQEVKIAQP